MLIFAAICLILLCSGMIPIKFALVLRMAGRSGFGSALAPLSNSLALKRAEKRASGLLPPRKKHRMPGSIPLLQTVGRLLRRGRLESVRAEGSIALGDAAHTALLCGAMQAAAGLLPQTTHLALQPDFSAAHSDAVVSCIISLRLGHIISAALFGALHYLVRSTVHGKASN